MVAPAVGAALIGGGSSILGGILGGKGQKKAADQASAAALQTAQMNNALARDIYGQNYQVLSPYANTGIGAGNMINALLGIPVQGQMLPSQPSFGGSGGGGGARGPMSPNARLDYSGRPVAIQDPQHWRMNALMPVQHRPGARKPADPLNAEKAFDIFRNSTGYQFRLGEGQRAINQGFAAAGSLRSGAAMKALQQHGQNIASDEFGRYLGYLSNQQGVGLSGASAIAGVGQNYVNNVTANNNSAGSAQANAALLKGQANAGMWSNIFGGLGTIAGGFGSSYGR